MSCFFEIEVILILKQKHHAQIDGKGNAECRNGCNRLRLCIEHQRIHVAGSCNVFSLLISHTSSLHDFHRIVRISRTIHFARSDFFTHNRDRFIILVKRHFQHLAFIGIHASLWIETMLDRFACSFAIFGLDGLPVRHPIRAPLAIVPARQVNFASLPHIIHGIRVFCSKPVPTRPVLAAFIFHPLCVGFYLLGCQYAHNVLICFFKDIQKRTMPALRAEQLFFFQFCSARQTVVFHRKILFSSSSDLS